MPFRFQQFEIDDRLCGMKVGTDGILLGSWTQLPNDAKRVLDIGTGSGLIAIMLAQRFANIQIDAIDLSESASRAATRNAQQSPWHQRISVRQVSLQSFAESQQAPYDAIVSNPPFFPTDINRTIPEHTTANASSQSPKEPESEKITIDRRLAREQSSLTTDQLLQDASRLLKPSGTFSLIIPTDGSQQLCDKAEQFGLDLIRETKVSSLPDRRPHRVLMQWVKRPASDHDIRDHSVHDYSVHDCCVHDHLTLEEEHHRRTAEYAALTSGFFLNP